MSATAMVLPSSGHPTSSARQAALRFGFPHTREVTDRLVDLGWRVIRYDLRGMGASDRDVEDLSLDGRVRDLAAVVGHLGLNRFALAGVDVGAVTAVAYAALHPALVSHLILLSPWASGARYLAIPELRAANAATTGATASGRSSLTSTGASPRGSKTAISFGKAQRASCRARLHRVLPRSTRQRHASISQIFFRR